MSRERVTPARAADEPAELESAEPESAEFESAEFESAELESAELESAELESAELESAELGSGSRRAAALTRAGMDLALAGRLREAVAAYDDAIRAADHLPALVNRACAYFHLGDYARAERDSGWALEVSAAQSYMWLLRGLARLRRGDAAGAREDLRTYLEVGRGERHRSLAQRTLRSLAA